MASISLMLKDNNAITKTRVIAKITDGRDYQIRLSTGFSVLVKHWSKKSKKVLSADSNSVGINKGLEDFCNKALGIYSEAKNNNIKPDREYFTREMTPTLIAENQNTQFWNVFDYYLEDKKISFTKSSKMKFLTLKKHLKGFETLTKIPLELDTITAKTMAKLQNYFFEDVIIKTDLKGNPVKGMNTQTTAKYLGNIKMFLNWAFENQYTKNIDYKNFKIKQQPKSIKAVLSDSDLDKLRQFNSVEQQYYNNARDLLILSCLTGLRYSDYSRIKPEHLKQNGSDFSLLIRQKKTNDYVEIPVNIEALSIIESLFSGKIHPISNQKMNAYAKGLCKLCGIDEPFETTQYRGNMIVNKTTPKYELITTHTGRRTFATNLLLKGVPAEIVMEFTGHRDYESFSKYVNVPKKSKMDIVRKAMTA